MEKLRAIGNAPAFGFALASLEVGVRSPTIFALLRSVVDSSL